MSKPDPRKRKSGEAEAVGALLGGMSRTLHLDEKAKEFALFALWQQVVGGSFQGRTRAVRLARQGEKLLLQVKVQDSVTASELSFYLETYREVLNEFQPQTGFRLDGIELGVGTLS